MRLAMLSVRISKDMEERLNRLSAKTQRSKGFYVKKALDRLLEEEEDYVDALMSYEDYLRSGKKGKSLEEMKKLYDAE
jgi:RHH-type transcriptional regulator, rel operon repressor / antitoxin RelB